MYLNMYAASLRIELKNYYICRIKPNKHWNSRSVEGRALKVYKFMNNNKIFSTHLLLCYKKLH